MCFFFFFPISKADKEFVWSLWKHLQVSSQILLKLSAWLWKGEFEDLTCYLRSKSSQPPLLIIYSLSF